MTLRFRHPLNCLDEMQEHLVVGPPHVALRVVCKILFVEYPGEEIGLLGENRSVALHEVVPDPLTLRHDQYEHQIGRSRL